MATSTCRTMPGTSCVGTADEIRVTYDYNSNLLPISETTRSGDGLLISTVTRDYDMMGNVIWVDGPAPGSDDRTYYFWNADREQIGEIGPDPDGSGPRPFLASRRQFDAEGRVSKIETGTASAQTLAALNAMTVTVTETFTYDALGHKLTDRRVGGNDQTLVQYSYGYKGLLECVAVRMNPAIYDSLPPSACALGSEGTQGPDRITRNFYDAAGRLVQVRGAVLTSDESAEVTRAYNASGQVTAIVDGNGNRATLHYDGFGRQDCWIFPSTTRASAFDDSTPTSALATAGAVSGDCVTTGDYERYGYDSNGNRTSLRKRDGSTINYQYDALNRVIVETVPERVDLTAAQTRDVYYSYDLQGLQLSARFDSQTGEGVTNSYDALGHLISSSTNMGGTTRTLAYQYDANGNRTRITYPDGTFFTYNYDMVNRLGLVRESGVNWLNGFSYTVAGLLDSQSYGGVFFTTFGYDGLGRLSVAYHNLPGTAQDVQYTYIHNPAGQLASRTSGNDAYAWTGHYAVNRAYTTNGLNQYIAAGTASFGYDANGNLTSDGSRTYTYDIENRLVGSSNGAALVYDPLGRLFQVTGPQPGGGTATTQFLYDGDALVAEYDGAGNELRRYVHNGGTDVPSAVYDGTGLATLRFLIPDERGSIIALSDVAGTSMAINTYDEYGIPGSANQGRFQYTGQAWLPELGMYYYKARIYSPTLGRFMQTDPIGYADQVNLYAYVRDDPLNRNDPSGKCSSIRNDERRTQCLEQRQLQVAEAKTYLSTQTVRAGSDEAAYIATYNEETGAVRVRTGDAAGRRNDHEVDFTDDNGRDLRARPDGRIVERVRRGPDRDTSEIVLVTGHAHPRDIAGGPLNSTDRGNESLQLTQR